MEASQIYERVIPLQKKGAMLRTCIVLCLVYGAIALGGTLWFLVTLNPYIAVLTVLLTVTVILLTGKYMRVEWEYSFAGDAFVISKIYGKSRRKTKFEADLKHLSGVDYTTPAALGDALRQARESILYATATPSAAPNSILMIFEVRGNESPSYRAVIIEGDERTEQLLRRVALSACSPDFRRGKRPQA